MSNETEFFFEAFLKKETPKEVIEALSYMFGYWRLDGGKYLFDKGIDTNLFTDSTLSSIESPPFMRFYGESEEWFLSAKTLITGKRERILDFVNFIKPYVSRASGEDGVYAYEVGTDSKGLKIYCLSDK